MLINSTLDVYQTHQISKVGFGGVMTGIQYQRRRANSG